MLNVARHNSPAICRYLRARAHSLPFADHQFDAVACVAGMPYLHDPSTALAQWRRVCSPAGSIVFSVPADGAIPEFRLLQQAASDHEIHLAAPDVGTGDRRRLTAIVEAVGLACGHVTLGTWTERLTSAPDLALKRFLSYGCAEPLRTASTRVQQRVLDDYRRAARAEHATGQASHPEGAVRTLPDA
jgi:SAM-dependent methyltransferase